MKNWLLLIIIFIGSWQTAHINAATEIRKTSTESTQQIDKVQKKSSPFKSAKYRKKKKASLFQKIKQLFSKNKSIDTGNALLLSSFVSIGFLVIGAIMLNVYFIATAAMIGSIVFGKSIKEKRSGNNDWKIKTSFILGMIAFVLPSLAALLLLIALIAYFRNLED